MFYKLELNLDEWDLLFDATTTTFGFVRFYIRTDVVYLTFDFEHFLVLKNVDVLTLQKSCFVGSFYSVHLKDRAVLCPFRNIHDFSNGFIYFQLIYNDEFRFESVSVPFYKVFEMYQCIKENSFNSEIMTQTDVCFLNLTSQYKGFTIFSIKDEVFLLKQVNERCQEIKTMSFKNSKFQSIKNYMLKIHEFCLGNLTENSAISLPFQYKNYMIVVWPDTLKVVTISAHRGSMYTVCCSILNSSRAYFVLNDNNSMILYSFCPKDLKFRIHMQGDLKFCQLFNMYDESVLQFVTSINDVISCKLLRVDPDGHVDDSPSLTYEVLSPNL